MPVYSCASMSSFHSLIRTRRPGLKLIHGGGTRNCTEALVQDSEKEPEKCV